MPTEVIRRTDTAVVTDGKTSPSQTFIYLVYFISGLLEFVLGARLILKLLGANPRSGFVNFIYGLSEPFVAPFYGIFRSAVSRGVETAAVLEPATIVAMIIYSVIAWGIVQLFLILIGHGDEAEVV